MSDKSKKNQTKKKKKIIKVSVDKPYYSSESLGKRFKSRLPSAISSAQNRKSIMGKASPRAAIMDVTNTIIDTFEDEEGKRGSRFAKSAAEKTVDRKKRGGGIVGKNKIIKGYKKGGKI